MVSDKVYKQYEQKYKRLSKLHFDENINFKIGKSVKDTVRNIVLNHKQSTYRKSGKFQFGGGNRTVRDIYLICKHYRPTVSFKEVCLSLGELISSGKAGSIVCGTIDERVFYKMENGYTVFENTKGYKDDILSAKYFGLNL